MPQTPVISYSDPTLDLWARFMRSRNLLYKLFSRDLLTLGIKPEQLGILNILKQVEGPVTPALISKIYRREPHTVSVNLKRLEAKGLISLTKDLTRKNMIRVEITEAGSRLLGKGLSNMGNISLVFAELSEIEISQLDGIIDHIAQTSQRLLSKSTHQS